MDGWTSPRRWIPGAERLSDSDWWWDHAFDGIASSGLTAALAFLGIWWALHHDRELASIATERERALAQEAARLSDEAARERLIWEDCRRVVDYTRGLMAELTSRTDHRDAITLYSLERRWSRELTALRNRFQDQGEPVLSEILEAALDRQTDAWPGDEPESRQKLQGVYHDVEDCLQHRMSHGREHWQAMPVEVVQGLYGLTAAQVERLTGFRPA